MDNLQNNNIEQNQNFDQDNKKDSGVGALIGSIIIVIIVVLGGLYYWGYSMKNKINNNVNNERATGQIIDPEIETINQALENTGLEDIDEELYQIEMEIDGALE
jgi:uncharacterized protein HemX